MNENRVKLNRAARRRLKNNRLRWQDGRLFERRVQVQVLSDGLLKYLYCVHAEEALRLCRSKLARVDGEDGNCSTIWRVVLVRDGALAFLRIGDPTGRMSGPVRREQFMVARYAGEGVRRQDVLAVVHQLNRVREEDLPLYRMAQLDALGHRWPYKKV